MRSSKHSAVSMTGSERRAAAGLAGIFALRMLGLFLVLPVFALHADGLAGSTPLLVGVAIGAYGLTQALLQIPFGMLSDRIGRKPVIFGGLLLFALGSILAAMADSIELVILGRIVQGSGAIAAAVMALAADLTREEVRTRAMAGIGISIGVAFAVALVAAPSLGSWIGLSGIFWLTAVLAVVGMLILTLVVPTPGHSSIHRDAEPVLGQIGGVLRNAELLRLDSGVLMLHMLMTSLFLVLPLGLVSAGLAASRHWMVYLPVFIASVVLMVPFIIQAERYGRIKPVLLGAVASLALALVGLSLLPPELIYVVPLLTVFFTGFNLLEASLPSLISKIAPAGAKGTAMGVFSSSQFAGAFLGGLIGGWMHQHQGPGAVYLTCSGMALLWLLIASGMRRPDRVSTRVIRIPAVAQQEVAGLQQQLLDVAGVTEAVVAWDEGVAYLKVDSRLLDSARLQSFCAS